jgi:hypothetical protein
VYFAHIFIHTNLQDPALSGSEIAVAMEIQHSYWITDGSKKFRNTLVAFYSGLWLFDMYTKFHEMSSVVLIATNKEQTHAHDDTVK